MTNSKNNDNSCKSLLIAEDFYFGHLKPSSPVNPDPEFPYRKITKDKNFYYFLLDLLEFLKRIQIDCKNLHDGQDLTGGLIADYIASGEDFPSDDDFELFERSFKSFVRTAKVDLYVQIMCDFSNCIRDIRKNVKYYIYGGPMQNPEMRLIHKIDLKIDEAICGPSIDPVLNPIKYNLIIKFLLFKLKHLKDLRII